MAQPVLASGDGCGAAGESDSQGGERVYHGAGVDGGDGGEYALVAVLDATWAQVQFEQADEAADCQVGIRGELFW